MADSSANQFPKDADAPRPDSAPMPRWKKILLITAGVLVAVGLALLPFGSGGDLSTSQGSAGIQGVPGGAAGSQFTQGGFGDGQQQLDENGNPIVAGAAESGDLSPVFLKLGFSFFVGFAIGYAFRQFLKLALIFVGLQLILLFGLTALGWVTVEWEIMADAWDGFIAQLGGQLESFRSFIAGGLPQAGLASLGLFTGFKRN